MGTPCRQSSCPNSLRISAFLPCSFSLTWGAPSPPFLPPLLLLQSDHRTVNVLFSSAKYLTYWGPALDQAAAVGKTVSTSSFQGLPPVYLPWASDTWSQRVPSRPLPVSVCSPCRASHSTSEIQLGPGKCTKRKKSQAADRPRLVSSQAAPQTHY